MSGLPLQTRVRNKQDGRTGTVCPDIMSTSGPNEVSVVWDGESSFDGTSPDLLEDLGPENAQVSEECGMGRETECCIFIVGDRSGLICERFGPMRFDCMMAHMSAERHPEQPYPNCKLSG